MIDANNGNILQAMRNQGTPNCGILHIKWSSFTKSALFSDSGGSVWSLSFSKTFGFRFFDSRCIFSGARGEVCVFEPLMISKNNQPLRNFTFTALATLSKLIVMLICPTIRVIKFCPLTGPLCNLPLLTWQEVLIELSDGTKKIDPVLAVARGGNMYFYHLTFDCGKLNLIKLRHIRLDSDLLSLHWMGPKLIAYVDDSENIRLLDLLTYREIDSLDLSSIKLVYSSASFKGLATGGNVSEALSKVAPYACYNSITCYESNLFMLSSSDLYVISARTWIERVNYLSKEKLWFNALRIALDGYRNAQHHSKKIFARNKILELLNGFLDAESKQSEKNLEFVINCLIEIKETTFLWGELWDQQITTTNFLKITTRLILNDQINEVSPSVAQSLCEFWLKEDLETLEQIILKLDWKCLDLHQVSTIAKKKNMFQVQLHLNANAMEDLTSSLIELIPRISSEINLGNHILVFISCCLTGRKYPFGLISNEKGFTVKLDVIKCLVFPQYINVKANDERNYPYLRDLLDFNTTETCNVLSLAFQNNGSFTEEEIVQHERLIIILLEIFRSEPTTVIFLLLNFSYNFDNLLH